MPALAPLYAPAIVTVDLRSEENARLPLRQSED